MCYSIILADLLPLPRQHSAVIGCTENCWAIGVIVNSFEGFYSNVGEEGDEGNCENTIFLEHPVHKKVVINHAFFNGMICGFAI